MIIPTPRTTAPHSSSQFYSFLHDHLRWRSELSPQVCVTKACLAKPLPSLCKYGLLQIFGHPLWFSIVTVRASHNYPTLLVLVTRELRAKNQEGLPQGSVVLGKSQRNFNPLKTFLEIAFCHVAQGGFEILIFLILLNAEIIGLFHHAQPQSTGNRNLAESFVLKGISHF